MYETVNASYEAVARAVNLKGYNITGASSLKIVSTTSSSAVKENAVSACDFTGDA